jgi:hypothetical protein
MTYFIVFLIVCGASIYGYVKLKSGEVLRFETTAAPRQVIMTVVGQIATKRRWTTLSQSDNSANFTYSKGPNLLVALVLFFFFIIPSIVYLIISRKKEALSLTVEQPGDGMSIVQITSNGWRGKSAARTVRSQVALAPGTSAALTATS